MPGIFFWILLSVSLLFVSFGVISVLVPKAAIIWDRRLYHRLKLISKDKLETPIKQRRIALERLQGCIFLVLGITLIYHPLGQLLRLRSNADDKGATDFKSAVKTIVGTEGLLLDAPEPRHPKELHIISAKYGARDTWMDVTEQVREKTQNNTLTIRASNAIAGDPLFGMVKTLKVEYVVDGEQKTSELREGVTLYIPYIDDPFDELKTITTTERLVALAEACPAEVGFYGKNFTTGKTVEYRPDQPACLASIVKIFVLLEVIRQADQGSLDLSAPISIERQGGKETSTVSAAVDKMIGISDNEATNALAKLVGYDRINALPKELGIVGLSNQILPEPGVLEKVLDKRVFGPKILPRSDLLPQHGTARGIVQYFELLNKEKLINARISKRVLDVFDKNPKNFAPRATPTDFRSGGKGGSIIWIRSFRPQYNMMGWGLLIRSEEVALAFCLWFEWFPENMSEEEKWQWGSGLSDSIVNILLLPTSKNIQNEGLSQCSENLP